METEGHLLPETTAEIRTQYDRLESAAKGVVRDVVRAMDFDGDEYDRRVTDEVIETAQDGLFASQLRVTVGTREEYEQWRADTDHELIETGSENVDNVAWHAPPATENAVAATFQNEPEAAVETLRRQAYGHLYQPRLTESEDN